MLDWDKAGVPYKIKHKTKCGSKIHIQSHLVNSAQIKKETQIKKMSVFFFFNLSN